jgi:hypothetical protein
MHKRFLSALVRGGMGLGIGIGLGVGAGVLGPFVPGLSTPARAQEIRDADRLAARELYMAGIHLQNDGKFAEALESFSRARKVIDAPTTVLHIAQCEAALGKLVEAVESYRELARFRLTPSSPAPFGEAQRQGAAEMPALEPRVPRLTIQVAPTGREGLAVTIDGEPILEALLGVPRPLNPGPHRVRASARGFSTEERSVSLREGERGTLTLTLTPVEGAPASSMAPGAKQETEGNAPSDTGRKTQELPRPYEGSTRSLPGNDSPGRLVLGIVGGLGIYSWAEASALADYKGVGFPLALTAAWGVLPRVRMGLEGHLTPMNTATPFQSPQAYGVRLVASFLNHPVGSSLYLEASGGPRWQSAKLSGQTSSKAGETFETGLDFAVGAGFQMPVTSRFAVVPVLRLGGGPMQRGKNGGGSENYLHVYSEIALKGTLSFLP